MLKLHGKVREVYLSLRHAAAEQVPVLLCGTRGERGGRPVNGCIVVPMSQRNEYESQMLLARKLAEEATRSKDEFLAVVSHELRAPLSSIIGWAHMLGAKKPDAETLERAVQTIGRNARLQASAGPVMGDADRLQQVLWNMLNNAVKFTPQGGRITVRLRRLDAQAEISVTDTGMGIGGDFLPFVFERFRQAEGGGAQRLGGVGLGMAIARLIVELHGGSISVASEGKDRGSTFAVRLPLAQVTSG